MRPTRNIRTVQLKICETTLNPPTTYPIRMALMTHDDDNRFNILTHADDLKTIGNLRLTSNLVLILEVFLIPYNCHFFYTDTIFGE